MTWEKKTLGELSRFVVKGITPAYVDEQSNSSIIVLNQKCNRDFDILLDDARFNDLQIKPVSRERYLQDGDVLINSTGTGSAGRVAQIWNIKFPITFDSHMILLRANSSVDPLFYGYAIKNQQRLIESFAEGSTGQTEINRSRLLNEVRILVPDLPYQRRIGKILKSIDDKIHLNSKINDNLVV